MSATTVERRRAAARAWRAANPERERANVTAYRAANREKVRAQSKAWNAAHPERVRAYSKAYRAAHPERALASTEAWRAANPEYGRAWLAANKDRQRANVRAWMAAHPENNQACKARRRARIASVLADLTPQEWDTILEAAGHACIYCGSQEQLSQDHLTPISKGGEHTAENVAPACMPCNQSKGAKTVMEFLAEQEEDTHAKANTGTSDNR